MEATMLFRSFLIFIVFFTPQIHALEANTHGASAAIDLIEFLGELDDDDTASLDAAMAEIELKKDTVTDGPKIKPQEMKK
jgi:hypothetical protein